MRRSTLSEARKKDTRDKIALGDLIVKATLQHEEPALLLGMLIDAAWRVRQDETEQSRVARIGAEAFRREGE